MAAHTEADLTGASLEAADLRYANLVSTILDGANLQGCRVYGASVWDLRYDGDTIQHDLVITPDDQDEVTVDDLKVAQFIYLLLKNPEIRNVIDTVGKKLVLILGRFSTNRKPVLEAIRTELRKRDYLPVLFDFEKPERLDLTETVLLLAHMARFVIADITDASAVQVELQSIVSNLPSLPVQTLLLESEDAYGMFNSMGSRQSVLPPHRYRDIDHLLETLGNEVIGPALALSEEFEENRREFEERLGR